MVSLRSEEQHLHHHRMSEWIAGKRSRVRHAVRRAIERTVAVERVHLGTAWTKARGGKIGATRVGPGSVEGWPTLKEMCSYSLPCVYSGAHCSLALVVVSEVPSVCSGCHSR